MMCSKAGATSDSTMGPGRVPRALVALIGLDLVLSYISAHGGVSRSTQRSHFPRGSISSSLAPHSLLDWILVRFTSDIPFPRRLLSWILTCTQHHWKLCSNIGGESPASQSPMNKLSCIRSVVVSPLFQHIAPRPLKENVRCPPATTRGRSSLPPLRSTAPLGSPEKKTPRSFRPYEA